MFENETKFNLEHRIEINSMNTKRILLLFCILGTVLMVLGTVLFVILQTAETLSIILDGVATICIGILMNYFMIYMLKKEHELSQYRENDTVTKYIFNQNDIIQKMLKKDELVSESKFKYQDILKVIETDNYILLYISNNNCFAINKKGMVVGELAELIKFLKTKITKYKKRKGR